ncbi:hypothetical protein BC826DRAFT_496602 [Russula brevipes]|nr:hypothetical protein BC826DRAFT_496602 [Russula brevipes]
MKTLLTSMEFHNLPHLQHHRGSATQPPHWTTCDCRKDRVQGTSSVLSFEPRIGGSDGSACQSQRQYVLGTSIYDVPYVCKYTGAHGALGESHLVGLWLCYWYVHVRTEHPVNAYPVRRRTPVENMGMGRAEARFQVWGCHSSVASAYVVERRVDLSWGGPWRVVSATMASNGRLVKRVVGVGRNCSWGEALALVWAASRPQNHAMQEATLVRGTLERRWCCGRHCVRSLVVASPRVQLRWLPAFSFRLHTAIQVYSAHSPPRTCG